MRKGNSEPYNTLDFSADSLHRIDEVCLRFEQEWQSGEAPSIESFLIGFDDQMRSALFAELLFLDIDYRTRAGQNPDVADYETRFPDDTPVIESAFNGDGETHRVFQQNEDLSLLPPLQELSLTSRFQLRQFHARGGLGVIYVAHDEKLERNVAVKFSRRRLPSSTEQMRLAREAEITGRLEHPGIVPVYATGLMENGLPCYVMQLIDGLTFQEAIRRFHDTKQNQPVTNPFDTLAFRKLLQRFIAVCNTVAYAHDHHVIHRDIKPGNIMLGKFGETFLLDWGLAKSLSEEPLRPESPTTDISHEGEPITLDKLDDQQLAQTSPSSTLPARSMTGSTLPGSTLPGQPIGTPAFASPEQIMGDVQQHNICSDVYSLGATLYCLLVGEGPVNLSELTNLKTASALREIRRPREVNRAVPRKLEAISLKAMAFEPKKRYASAQHLANDLERFLADEPVTVLRERWTKKTLRWGRKHRWMVASLAAAILVSVAALALGSYLLGSKNKQLQASNTNLLLAKEAQQQANAETLAALGSLTDEIIERSLARQASLTNEDREFLGNIIERYERLSQIGGNEIKAIEMRAEGFYRVGQLNRFLGRKKEAHEMWNQALSLETELSLLSSPKLIELIARTHSRNGLLLMDLGHHNRAVTEIQVAISLFTQLIQEFPEVVSYRLELSRSQSELGVVQNFVGLHVDAAESFKKSLSITDELEDKIPTSQYLRQRKASAHNNLGTVLRSLHQMTDAVQQYVLARELFLNLIEEYPSTNSNKLALAQVYLNLAGSQRQLQNFEVAEENCSTSIEKAASLNEAFPLVPEYSYQLGLSRFEMAKILMATKRTLEAFQQYEQALEEVQVSLKKSDGDFRFRKGLIEVLNKIGFERITRKQLELADPYVDESLKLSRQQLEDDQGFRSRYDMVIALMAKGSLYMYRSQFEDALKYYIPATEYLREMELDHENAKTRQRKIVAHRAAATAMMKLDQYDESLDHWKQFNELTNFEDISGRVFATFCLAHSYPVEAVDLIEVLAKMNQLSPADIYSLSCAAAVAAKSLESPDVRASVIEMALTLLERTIESQYFRDAAIIESFRLNSSFSELQDNRDFVEIVSRIELEE